MSFCRWSTDHFRCDLYCYEDVSGGFTTHVAARKRLVSDDPPEDIMGAIQRNAPSEETMAVHKRYQAWLDALPIYDLELPHGGERFNDDTLEEFKERLLYLRGLGYRFPDYVLEAVEEEIKENDRGTQ